MQSASIHQVYRPANHNAHGQQQQYSDEAERQTNWSCILQYHAHNEAPTLAPSAGPALRDTEVSLIDPLANLAQPGHARTDARSDTGPQDEMSGLVSQASIGPGNGNRHIMERRENPRESWKLSSAVDLICFHMTCHEQPNIRRASCREIHHRLDNAARGRMAASSDPRAMMTPGRDHMIRDADRKQPVRPVATWKQRSNTASRSRRQATVVLVTNSIVFKQTSITMRMAVKSMRSQDSSMRVPS